MRRRSRTRATWPRHAARIGATAISSLPPSGPGFGFAEARRYYAALAAASELPLVVYYFPEVYPSIRTLDQLEEMCALSNVAGVKFTDFDLSVMAAVAKPGRVVFNGRDEVLAAGLLMGAHGGIGSFYNLVPEQFVDIDALARAGRWAEVRERQDSVNALITAVLRFPLFPAIKQILTWSGIPCGNCLVPRSGLVGRATGRVAHGARLTARESGAARRLASLIALTRLSGLPVATGRRAMTMSCSVTPALTLPSACERA